MPRTFTIASDDSLITLIKEARNRLAIIAPALTTPVAEALAGRMADLPSLSLTVILDADAEVYRMGYGDPKALEIIRDASNKAMFELREQPGVRIGVVISDDRTMVYAPVSRNVEAGSTTEKKPNAIVLDGGSTERLAEAAGVAEGEIGQTGMKPERVAQMEADLNSNPPRPFDLTRKLTVFMTEVQFIDLEVKNATLSSRQINLPPSFQKLEDAALRRNIQSRLKMPIDLTAKIQVKIGSWRGDELLEVNEPFIRSERDKIDRTFFHDWKGRGKVILRKDKEQLKRELDRLIAVITAYHSALKNKFEESKTAFRDRLVAEFVKLWQKSPPDHLRRRGQVTEDACRLDIKHEADGMFDKSVTLGTAEAKVIYKDISIEDLQDEELMAGLRKVMENAGVDPRIVEKLFQSGDAAAAEGSFEGI